MKQITIGEISISSEDGDEWEKLLEVTKRAKQIYVKAIKELEKEVDDHWMMKLMRKVIRK